MSRSETGALLGPDGATWREMALRLDAKVLAEQRDHNLTVDRLIVAKAQIALLRAELEKHIEYAWRGGPDGPEQYVVANDSATTALKATETLDTPSDRYLVWSNEHTAWWRPNAAGYCTSVADAGRFTKEEAEDHASCRSRLPNGDPPEVVVTEADAIRRATEPR